MPSCCLLSVQHQKRDASAKARHGEEHGTDDKHCPSFHKQRRHKGGLIDSTGSHDYKSPCDSAEVSSTSVQLDFLLYM